MAVSQYNLESGQELGQVGNMVMCSGQNSNNPKMVDMIYVLLILYIFNMLMLKRIKQVGSNCCFVEGETVCYIIPNYFFTSIG